MHSPGTHLPETDPFPVPGEIMLDRVEVQGDAVHFDLKTLSFDGRLSGRTLSGSVTDKAAGTSSGQFVLTRVDPRAVVYEGP
jgi:hypothetical protein